MSDIACFINIVFSTDPITKLKQFSKEQTCPFSSTLVPVGPQSASGEGGRKVLPRSLVLFLEPRLPMQGTPPRFQSHN